MDDFFSRIPGRAKVLGWAILMGPLILLFIVGALFLRPDPIDPRTVWGCYRLEGAPPLSVKRDRIDILDGTGRSFDYLAEPYKEGYARRCYWSEQLAVGTSSRRLAVLATSGHC